MSNAAAVYQLSRVAGLMHNASYQTLFMRDGEQVEVEYAIDAQVRSGDYFVTLATVLDQLSRQVPNYEERAQLEEVVSDLIYLQDNYTIVKNQP